MLIFIYCGNEIYADLFFDYIWFNKLKQFIV
jgi:hypothetical protein